MSDNYVRLADTISSKEGRAFITINGEVRDLFEISSLKAQIDLTVQARRTLGHRMTQHKVVGAEGTGSMTMYFMNSDMLKLTVEYLKGGMFGDISIRVVNEDPQSSVGKQEINLKNVLLKTIPVATLDDQSDDPITIDADFTFDSLDDLTYFNLPANY
jgi:hypothetical protein